MRAEIGYVVGKDETNPITVWFPGKGGYNKTGSNRGFGSNTGNMNLTDLSMIRMNSEKCYITTPLSAQSPYLFDDRNGFATREDNAPFISYENVKNVGKNKDGTNRYSSPGDSSYFQIPHANPASNFLETYYPQQIGGVEMNNYDNAPGGSYCTLGIGTRVLVIFTDNSVYGFIIAQVPYEDEMSQVIKNLKED
jgi:hypothetical protein